jgi:hypothetical protein
MDGTCSSVLYSSCVKFVVYKLVLLVRFYTYLEQEKKLTVCVTGGELLSAHNEILVT